MDRRTLLQAGALTGVAAASSCAELLPRPDGEASDALPEEELLGRLTRLAQGMDRISNTSLVGDFIARTGRLADPANAAVVAGGEQLGKKAMRMLYLTGTFRDLPEASRADPRVQQLVRDAMPEMDDAMLGTARFLDGLTDTQHAKISQVLQERPEVLDQIGAELARQAEAGDVPLERRLHLRSLVKQVGWRMQRQSPRAVIEDYVEKVQRVSARNGADAEAQRAIAASAAEELFWAQVGAPPASDPPLVPAEPERAPLEPPPVPPPDAPAGTELPARRPSVADGPPGEQTPAEPPPHRGKSALTAGALVFGFGVVTAGVGALIVAYGGGASLAGAFVITLGAVGAIAGLITLLVGAILWANG